MLKRTIFKFVLSNILLVTNWWCYTQDSHDQSHELGASWWCHAIMCPYNRSDRFRLPIFVKIFSFVSDRAKPRPREALTLIHRVNAGLHNTRFL